MLDNYGTLFQRNQGYVDSETQRKLSKVRVLVAGCGIGSTIAVALARIGVQHFTLVDGDTIEAHNLNRQAFGFSDIGKNKAVALGEAIRSINPDSRVTALATHLDSKNIAAAVRDSDLVLDTIDFLDLSAIVGLHDEAHRQKRPLLSCLAAGFGAAALWMPPTDSPQSAIRGIFPLRNASSENYAEVFGAFIRRIEAHLNPRIAQVLGDTIRKMLDGTPCPAPQVSAGAFCAAALGATIVTRWCAGETIVPAPMMHLIDLYSLAETGQMAISVAHEEER